MKHLPKLITLASLTLTFWCFSDKIASKLIYISRNLNPYTKKLKEPIITIEKPSPLEFKTIQCPPETIPTNLNYPPIKIQIEKESIYQPIKYKETPELLYQNK